MYSGMEKDGKEEAVENGGERGMHQRDGLWEGWGRGGLGGGGLERKRLRDFCSICGIIIRCVSVWVGKDIIKKTRGRLGSRSCRGSATLPSLLPLNLCNLPLF